MSKMGVPSRRSAPNTWTIGPSSVSSTWSILTQVNPMGLGRNGLRVANTPMRSDPPKRGGLTVGDHFVFVPLLSLVAASAAMSCAVPPGVPFSNSQSSHACEKPSSPATALFSANSGSKTMRPCKCGARKLLRGMHAAGPPVVLVTSDVLSVPSYPIREFDRTPSKNFKTSVRLTGA